MKKLLTVFVTFLACAASHSGFAVTVTVVNMDIRATILTGTTSDGTIDLQPAATLANNNSESEDVLLRWAGLTLDGSGTGDDHIDFIFNVSVSAGAGNINFNGQGLRPNSWQTGETLTVSFVSATSSTGGAVSFDGFTGAGLGLSGNASTVNGDGNAGTINGNAVSNSLGGIGAYQYVNTNVDFAASSSVVYALNTEDATIAESWTRNYDFGFTVIPEPSAALLGSLGLIALLRRKR